MGDGNNVRTQVLCVVVALTALACCLIVFAGACGPDDDGAGGGGSDAGPDSGGDGDAGSDAGADAGDDGGADSDTDADTDTSGVPPACDPRICDDGCYRAGKDYGECVGALCECFGNRDMDSCGCAAVGARDGARIRALRELLLEALP